jgi:hypothetical protein
VVSPPLSGADIARGSRAKLGDSNDTWPVGTSAYKSRRPLCLPIACLVLSVSHEQTARSGLTPKRADVSLPKNG